MSNIESDHPSTCYLIGDSFFSLECAQILIDRGYIILGIKSTHTEFIVWAKRKKIPCFATHEEFEKALKSTSFDYLFSLIHSRILSEEALRQPKEFAINYHNAPLPRYAGRHAPSWAILNGEERFGITWHAMEPGIDSGPILKQIFFQIEPKDTALSLDIKCTEHGIQTFPSILSELENGTYKTTPQDLHLRSYYTLNQKPKNSGILDFSKSAEELYRIVKASSFPGQKNIFVSAKVYSGSQFWIPKNFCILPQKTKGVPPGHIIQCTEEKIKIATQTNDISIDSFFNLSNEIFTPSAAIKTEKLHDRMCLPLCDSSASEEIHVSLEHASRNETYWKKFFLCSHENLIAYLPTQPSDKIKKPSFYGEFFFTEHLQHDSERTLYDLLSVLFVYLHRINDGNNYTIALHHPEIQFKHQATKLLFSEAPPFEVNLDGHENFTNTLSTLEKNLKKQFTKFTYAKDLFIRHPDLEENKNFAPIILVSFSEKTLETKLNYPIHFIVEKNLTSIKLYVDEHFFSEDQKKLLKNIFPHLQFLKESIDAYPEMPIDHLPFIPEREYETLVAKFSGNQTTFGLEKNIVTLFAEQVHQHGNRIALQEDARQITYAELDVLSNRFARYLKKLFDGKKEPRVIVFTAKKLDAVFSFLSILKAGGVYVPIDPSFPEEYIHTLFTQIDPAVILFSSGQEKNKILSILDHAKTFDLDLDLPITFSESADSIENEIPPTQLAYILYTSGTTGRPKGVMIEHRSIVRLVCNTNYIKINAVDRIAQAANIGFDAATFEIWGALLNGATLICIKNDIIMDISAFSGFLSIEKISILWLTAGLFNQFVTADSTMFKNLKYLLVGGEALNPKKIHLLFNNPTNTPKHVLNGYGPTENTTFSATFEIQNVDTNQPIPIGNPISHSTAYVLDHNLHLLPIGVPGELYVGGHGLARGYWKQADLTTACFIFRKNRKGEIQRLYKTGDHACWSSTGDLLYLGRKDSQIKIRGFRVEIEAVEAALLSLPEIKHCLVFAHLDNAGTNQLIACVVPSENIPELDWIFIKAKLQKQLPTYMMPAFFYALDALPLTTNGKINIKKLKEIPLSQFHKNKVYTPPRDSTETILHTIWTDLLKVNVISVDDNFFELGGHSLLLSQLLFKVEHEFGSKISIHDFLDVPTIASLARLLKKNTQLALLKRTNLTFIQDAELDIHIQKIGSSSLKKVQNVLLTGATGFLGSYILNELCSRKNLHIFCLIKETSVDLATIRLKEIFKKYKISFEPKCVTILLGDISKPFLGLEEKTWETLTTTIDIIYHCAAYVHHIYNYETLKKQNVGSTITLLRLATTFKEKVFCYVSSLSAVAENYDANGKITEDFLDTKKITQRSANGYAQSKWVSEQLLAQAKQRGIPVRIYRPGWITGDSKTGIFDPKMSHLFLLIRGCIEMGAAPNWSGYLNLLPVDFLSRFIIADSLNPLSAQQVFNVLLPRPMSWLELISWLNARGYPIKIVPSSIWIDKYLPTLNPNNELFPLLPLYREDQSAHWLRLGHNFDVAIEHTDFAVKSLNIRFPLMNHQLLTLYFSHLESIGFLKLSGKTDIIVR